jgi:hypothetical protein
MWSVATEESDPRIQMWSVATEESDPRIQMWSVATRLSAMGLAGQRESR